MTFSTSDDITMMNTVHEIENIFQKIKDDKKGRFDYDEILKELSQQIMKKFPDCQRNISVRINENYMNGDLNVHFIINSIPVCISNNEHNMAPGFVFGIMHVLACKFGISINFVSDYKFELESLQNPNYQ